MLKDILRIINQKGYFSQTMLAAELAVPWEIVGEGLAQLRRMGYILEEETGQDCSSFCTNCQFAKACSKEIVKTFILSDKGQELLRE